MMAVGVGSTGPGRLDRPGWIAASVFLTALAVRLLHVWQISGEPFFSLYMSDATDFHAWAVEIAQGKWLREDVFYHAPLYPYFLGVVYSTLGSDPLILRIVQAVIGAAACAFLSLAGWRLFSPRAGLIAGLLLAFYAPAIFFDGIIQDSALDVLLGSLLLWLLAEISFRGRPLLWLCAGLVLGAAMMARENTAVLALPILLWLFLQREQPRATRLGFAALFVIGGALALAPVAAHNRLVGGELRPMTFNTGANLFIGNNPQADGYYRPLRVDRGNPRFEIADMVQIAEAEEGRELSDSEVSAYWTGRALDYVRSQPVDWLALLAKKFFLAWNATERSDTEDQYTYADQSLPLRLTGYVLHFGVLAPLALLGVWVTWPERRRLWLFYLMPITYMASVIVFFVFARYRYPVVPGLVLLAGAGLAGLPRFLREGSRQRLAVCSAAVLAAAVFSNWPTIPKSRLRADTHANVGAALDNAGKPEQALGYLLRSVELNPQSGKAHYYLATALQRRRRIDEALRHYEQALHFSPSNPQVHNNYGAAVASLGDLDAAAAHFQQAIDLDPLFAEAYVNLGNLYRLRGDLERAFRLYERAAEVDPEPGSRLRLAGALLLAGATESAFDLYAASVGEPGFEREMGQVLQLAWSLATSADSLARDAQRALEIVRLSTDLVGTSPMALRTEAAALAAAGRFEEAISPAEKALQALTDMIEEEVGEANRLSQLADQVRSELELYRRGQSLVRPNGP